MRLMKSNTVFAGLLVIIASAMLLSGMNTPKEETVRHVVVFKYKEGAPQEKIDIVTNAFRSLKDKIPGIVAFEHGVNNSPEGKNQGFTHVYLLTFENEAARDVYLPHPEHVKFGEVLRGTGIFEDAFVVDYVPSE